MRTRHNATRNIFSSREPLTARANVPAKERKRALTNCQNNWTELPNALAAQDVNF